MALGIVRRTVTRWAARKDWPFGAGPYDVRAVERWRRKRPAIHAAAERRRCKDAGETDTSPESRWERDSTISRKEWLKLSGHKLPDLIRHGDLLGVDFRCRIVDVAAVARGLHDLLSRQGHRMVGLNDDESAMVGPSSPALERYREERARLAEMDLAERQNNVIPRINLRAAMAIFAKHLERAAQRLEKEVSSDAALLVHETWSECERLLNDLQSDPRKMEQ